MTMMVRFTGWREGFKKIPFTKLLAQHVPLPMAKSATDDLLDFKAAEVRVMDIDAAYELRDRGEALGAIGEVMEAGAATQRQPHLVS